MHGPEAAVALQRMCLRLERAAPDQSRVAIVIGEIEVGVERERMRDHQVVGLVAGSGKRPVCDEAPHDDENDREQDPTAHPIGRCEGRWPGQQRINRVVPGRSPRVLVYGATLAVMTYREMTSRRSAGSRCWLLAGTGADEPIRDSRRVSVLRFRRVSWLGLADRQGSSDSLGETEIAVNRLSRTSPHSCSSGWIRLRGGYGDVSDHRDRLAVNSWRPMSS